MKAAVLAAGGQRRWTDRVLLTNSKMWGAQRVAGLPPTICAMGCLQVNWFKLTPSLLRPRLGRLFVQALRHPKVEQLVTPEGSTSGQT